MAQLIKRFFWIYIFFASFLIHAQSALDLDSIISLGLKHDYSIKLLNLELQKINQTGKIIKASRLPTLGSNFWTGYSEGRYYDALSNRFVTSPSLLNSSGLTINWSLYKGNYNRIKLGENNVILEVQKLNLEKRKREVTKEIINLYFDIVQNCTVLKLFKLRKDNILVEAARIRELFLFKKVTYVDTSMVFLSRSEVELKQLQLELKIEQSLQALTLLTNTNLLRTDIKDIGSFDIIKFDLKNPKYLIYEDTSVLRRSSIIYKLKQIQAESMKIEKRLQRSQFKPTVNLTTGVYTGYSSNLVYFEPSTNKTTSYPLQYQLNNNVYSATGFNIYVPLYDRRSRLIHKQEEILKEINEVELNQTSKIISSRYFLSKKDLSIKYGKLVISNSQLAASKRIFKNSQEQNALSRLNKDEFFLAKESYILSQINFYDNYFDFLKSLKAFETEYVNDLTY